MPLSSLSSTKQKKNDQGTFETGLLFLDWLKKTGQSAWQLLPLHQTQLEKGSSIKRVPSPYKGYGIGLDPKYLSSSAKVKISKNEINKFVQENKYWINDYAFFCALSDYFKTDNWKEWDTGLRTRNRKVLDKWSQKLRKEIDRYIFLQCLLHNEYEKLKHKAKKLNISLIGDLPFYLPVQSPLVWAYQDLFQLGIGGGMKYVSGVPDGPSAFFGRQVWGHPLYKWGTKKQNDKVVTFWEMRLRYLAKLFDSIRIDYAKGFIVYGSMDPKNKKNDSSKEGPGYNIFKKLVQFCKQCGLWIYAEDNGQNIKELQKFMKILEIPGIKIFRFAFDEKKNKINKEYAEASNYPKNTVAYTTTHDTETLVGYLQKLTEEQKQRLSIVSKIAYYPDIKKFAKKIRDTLLRSPAKIVIIPIQDWLLTTDRINIPGTEKEVNDQNWQYKVEIPIEDLPIIPQLVD